MKHKQAIPLQVPTIGGNPKQSPVDISQAVMRKCPCGHEFFNLVYRLGTVSKLAPGNTLNQDMMVQIPAFLCAECGTEFKAMS